MPKPVCVACQCFYRPKQNGFAWIEGKPYDGPVAADPKENVRGRRRPEVWTPYKLWNSDLWECPDCGHKIIVGHASGPAAEHCEANFNTLAKQYGARLQVNDC